MKAVNNVTLSLPEALMTVAPQALMRQAIRQLVVQEEVFGIAERLVFGLVVRYIILRDHHYRAFNKMADSAANLAMDTRTSTQVHFPTDRAAFNNLTQDLDNDVIHWLMRSSEDPRSLDNTRQPHIGRREHAILVKDYLALASDLVQSAL
ncbi:hypothetical protein FI667_g9627, partial [Globisporangium splendens]